MQKSKKMLITGATSGVGYALAKRLLKEKYDVWVTGRSSEVLLELQKDGAHSIQADLSKNEDLEYLVDQMDDIDGVIFSAGIGSFDLAHETSDEVIRKTFEVNVFSPMILTKRLLPNMMDRKSGHFIYLGSQAGKVATPKASVYAASKHALNGYTNALRMEVAPFNIHVSTINPGPIDSPFLDLADRTGNYRTALGKHLLNVNEVVDAIIETIEKPVREVNLPRYMGFTSKLHALAPSLVERIGRKFFLKKG